MADQTTVKADEVRTRGHSTTFINWTCPQCGGRNCYMGHPWDTEVTDNCKKCEKEIVIKLQ